MTLKQFWGVVPDFSYIKFMAGKNNEWANVYTGPKSNFSSIHKYDRYRLKSIGAFNERKPSKNSMVMDSDTTYVTIYAEG